MDFRFGFGVPGGAVVAVVLLLGLMVFVVAGIRDLRDERSRRRRWALAGLRVLTAVAVWLVASQPQWTGERIRREPGRLAVLVDGSRSMNVRAGRTRRADRAREVLEGWREEADDPGTSFHVFGGEVKPASLDELAREYPTGADETRIVPSIEAVARADAGGDLGALLILSDGADTEGRPDPSRIPRGLRVHAVAIGDDVPLRDDAIARVQADPIAFLRQPAEVRVVVRSSGGEGASIPVTLREEGQVIREMEVQLDDDGEGAVEIPFTPDRLGRAVYRLSIPTDPDDAVPENNERAFLVRVTRDRLRVLLVAGQPTWDVRFLRAFLKRDPSIDLISFFILRTGADLTMASPDELALIPFPTDELFREHLGSFDVVLFQNFDYGPYGMAPYLSRIRDYVVRGGSFAMIGGDLSFTAGGYPGTPIAEILPVRMPPAGASPETALVPGRFRPELAPELMRHPLLELLPDPAANASTWISLAPLDGANLLAGVRPDGRALLLHPERRVGGEPMPVLAVGTAGKGRTMALATDGTWRWGMTTAGTTGDPSAYDRFWDRSLRWLARDPSLDPCQITTGRERYGPDAEVRVEALLRDDRYEPLTDRSVRLEVIDGAEEVVSEARSRTDGRGRLEATVPGPDRPGGFRLVARLEEEADARCDVGFVVEAGGRELADPRARPEWLRGLAADTGGRFHGGASGAPDLDALDASRTRSMGLVTVAPMATPWAFLAVVALLAGEWMLRRRWGHR